MVLGRYWRKENLDRLKHTPQVNSRCQLVNYPSQSPPKPTSFFHLIRATLTSSVWDMHARCRCCHKLSKKGPTVMRLRCWQFMMLSQLRGMYRGLRICVTTPDATQTDCASLQSVESKIFATAISELLPNGSKVIVS